MDATNAEAFRLATFALEKYARRRGLRDMMSSLQAQLPNSLGTPQKSEGLLESERAPAAVEEDSAPDRVGVGP